MGCALWAVGYALWAVAAHLLLRQISGVSAEASEQLRHQAVHPLIACERTARAHAQLALRAVEPTHAEPPE
eukprot:scaffold4740_cov59-Phaeocystis_antarctica.AAC.2